MSVLVYLLPPAAFGLALWLTALVRRLALSRGLLDIPNERSSHSVPTPRGGGIAIVVAMLTAVAVTWAAGIVDAPLALALAGGGSIVALIGFLDDRSPVPSYIRLVVHLAAGAWALYCLGGLPSLQIGARVYDAGAAGVVLGVLGLVWAVNLFNFMDGIDGIAASQSTFMAWGAFAVLASGSTSNLGGEAVLMLVLGAASAGFLVWNWPPARIFMGDVGSGFVGFAIGVLAIASGRQQLAALPTWAILGALFIADTGVTLCTRVLRRQRIHVAHRTHAYQLVTERWGSHQKVTLAFLSLNCCLFLPTAWLAAHQPDHAIGYVVLALGASAAIAVSLGAGRGSN